MPRLSHGQVAPGSERRRSLPAPAARRCVLEQLEARRVLSISPPGVDDDDGVLAAELARPYVADEMIVALRSPGNGLSADLEFAQWEIRDQIVRPVLENAQLLSSVRDEDGQQLRLLHFNLAPGADVPKLIRQLSERPEMAWAAPNYVYEGDPRELVPNDPSYAGQYHHPLMRNDLAWDVTMGTASTIVAVTDDGVDWDHTDLITNIWNNSDEIPGNLIDDDANGYVDDVRGWDFSSGDNNPNHDGTDNHGTHVAGIVAARTNNGVGVAGVAGAATIMPVRFYGDAAWTSALILESYTYAVDNGAKIISTSYSIDSFVGDPTFLSALNYVYSHGVLHFNSAGNNSQLNPPRQAFDQILFVASTDSADLRSSFSNYGTGIDIAAPGTSISSTLPNNLYGSMSGTSMATPNAAGAAALIWSLHPTWTRDQVAAQLLGTADNIDSMNPLYAGLLGAGRIDTYSAVSATLAPPRLKGVSGLPAEGKATSTAPTSLTVQLDDVFSEVAIENATSWELRSDGADNVFGNGDDQVITLTRTTDYMVGTNQVVFNVGAMPVEHYRFRAISGGLADPFGMPLDGNSDGVGGDDFVRTFDVVAPISVVATTPPSGSTLTLPLTSITFGFSKAYDAASIIPADLMLSRGTATGVTFDDADTATFTIDGLTYEGPLVYSFAAGAILDTLGADGAAYSGSYSLDAVSVAYPTLESLEPKGSLIYGAPLSASITNASDTDGYTLTLDAGQTISVGLAAGAGLQAEVLLLGPVTSVSQSAAGPGVGVALQNITVPSAGTYTITVSGLAGTLGNYDLDVLLNSAVEAENLTGVDNNTFAVAQDLSGGFLTLANGAQRAAVVGTSSGPPMYASSQTKNDVVFSPNVLTYTFTGAGTPSGDATLTVTAIADLDGADEYLTLNAEGVYSTQLFVTGGQQQVQVTTTVTISQATLAALTADGTITMTVTPSIAMNNLGANFLTLALSYASGFANPDYYQFGLTAGQMATLVTSSLSGDDHQIELYDSSFNRLAVGDATKAKVDNVVENFVAPATGVYYARVVSNQGGSYSLLVTRNSAFDLEANDDLDSTQLIGPAHNSLGYLGKAPTGSADSTGTDAAGSANHTSPPAAAPPPADASSAAEYVADRLIVAFKSATDAESQAAVLESLGGSIVSTLGFIGAAVVEVAGEGLDMLAEAARWAAHPAVRYAEPDYVVYATQTIPNDSQFSSLWGMHNTGQTGGTPDADIDAPEAWDNFTGSTSVVVASIDTGVDYNHPDLAANMWVNPGEVAGDGIDNDSNGFIDDIYGLDTINNDSNPFDDHYHGTHTMGTTGGVGNNGVGVAGVNWNIKIMALKFLGASGSGSTSDAVEALDYITMMKTLHNVNIVASNNSWGGGGFSQALSDAILASNNAGIMFVASAGNANNNNDISPSYPATYNLDGIISVAATDNNDAKASFSSYGATTVDLGAPGVGINSTRPNNTYGLLNGTSMAAPHVSGAVAMLMAQAPQASLAEVKAAILNGVDPVPSMNGITLSGGRLNLAKSLNLIGDRGDYYKVSVQAGDLLVITTSTPGDGPNDPENGLDPKLQLYNPSGQLVSTASAGAGDGRNVVLDHVALASGNYTVRVYSESGQGEYTLSVTGATRAEPAFVVTGTSPADGVTAPTTPPFFVVDFNDAILVSSLQAGDLLVDGVPAASVTLVDHNTARFTFPVALTETLHTVSIAAGAIVDLQGTPLAAYNGQFSLWINDAPVLNNSGTPILAAINEDVVGGSGTTVTDLIASGAGGDPITDPDTGAVEGIAVYSVSNTNGAWQFSLNDGATWTAFGTPSTTASRLLASAPGRRIRFVPNANFTGTVTSGLFFRAWDHTSGVDGGTADTNTNGGITAFSTATETANITVLAVNDGPQNVVPPALNARSNSPLVFSAANGNAISIVDIDAGSNAIRTTLTATGGLLTLGSFTGLSFNAGDGVNDVTLTITGTLANVNAALAGLKFEPTSGLLGAASVQISTTDLGSTGSGGAQVDTDTVNITLATASTGKLDPTFDFDGWLTTSIGKNSGDQANAVVVQGDGKILAVGRRQTGSAVDFVLARYNSDGTLDPTFDGDGKVELVNSETARGVTLQWDGKIIVVGGLSSNYLILRYNPDGSLDTTFSGDGVQTTDFGSTDEAYAVELQQDGKIVVAGRSFVSSTWQFSMARYNPDGSPDTTFDTDGKAVTKVGTGNDFANAMTLQADGKIVMAGYSSGTNDDFSAARFNTDGSLDTTFNLNGKVLVPVGTGTDRANGVAVQADGGIVLAGSASNGSNDDIALVRLNPDGTLDTTFDTDGKVMTPVGTSTDQAWSVKIQADQQILVAGYSFVSTFDFAVLRYDPNGVLDTTFDTDGKVTTPVGTGTDQVFSLALQADDKIVVAGYSNNGVDDDFAIARYLPNGQADASFNLDGSLTTPFGPATDLGYGVAMQTDGKIIAVGHSYNGASYDFGVARYTTSGALDPSFSADGLVMTGFTTTSTDQAYAATVQVDGKIVVAGVSSSDFAVARYNTDGTLDTTFDTDGKVTTPILSSTDIATAVVMQSDGKIVVAGYSSNGTNNDFAVARYNTNGSLDTTFDTDGKVTVAIGTSTDQAYGVAIQADGKIVVVGYATMTNNDFAVVRFNADGSLDTTFDTDGKLTTTIGTSTDQATAVALQADGKIVVAGYATMGAASFDFAVVRYNTNGSLDNTFDSDGKLNTPMGTASDQANGVAIQVDGKIIVGGSAFVTGNDNEFAVARYNTNGSLDTTFDGDGKAITTITTGSDIARGVFLQPDGRTLLVGQASVSGVDDFALTRYEGDPPTTTGIANQSGTEDGPATLVDLFPSFADITDLDSQLTYSVTSISNPSLVGSTSINSPTGVLTLASAQNAFGSSDIRVRATDRSGLFVETTFTYTVTQQIDPVALVTPSPIVARANHPHYFTDLNDSAITIVAPDIGNLPLEVSLTSAHGKFSVSNLAGLTFTTGDGLFDATMTFRGTLGAVSAAINGLEFDPTSGLTGAASVQINLSDLGNSGAGFAQTDSKTISFNLVPVSTGSLDPTFDSDGMTTAALTDSSTDEAYAVTLQSDGKILALGRRFTGLLTDLALVRYNTDGSLDSTFSDDGKFVLTTFDSARAMAVQADGKIVVVGLSSSNYAVARFNTDGTLDTTFSGDGIQTADLLNADEAFGVAIQGDGKIVVGGTSNSSASFSAARFLSDGTLDNSFDTDGKVVLDIVTGTEVVNAIALQTDGKIVLAGRATNGSNDDFAVVRLNTDGSMDNSFDSDGKTLTPVGTTTDQAFDCVIQPDGKIILAGVSTSDYALVRYNTDGSLDTSFDGDGKVITAIGTSTDTAEDVILQPDGKIVALGYSLVTATSNEFSAVRYNTDGSLDTSFDTDGKLLISLSANADIAYAASLQADGKMILAGSTSADGRNLDFALARINPNGSLDTTFDGDGVVITPIGGATNQINGVAIQPDGKIVAVGRSYNGQTDDFSVVRYRANGKLDTSFDGDGKIVTQMGSVSSDNATSVLLQPDGKIVAVGTSAGNAALARYNPDGSLDGSFDGDGIAVADVGGSTDTITTSALQSDGKIVVAGYAFAGSTNDLAVARFNSDGSLDTTFDGDGKLVMPVTPLAGDQFFGAAIQSDGKIVLVGFTIVSGFDFLVVRYNSDGSLDTTFGSGGMVITPFSGTDQANAVAIQPDGKIVVAGYSNAVDFAVARYNTNGTLDTTFDTDGKVTTPVGISTDQGFAMQIQADGKIVVAGSAINSPNGTDFAMVRYNTNGSLDTSFDGDGKVITTFGAGTDVARGLAIQADGRPVLAGYTDMGGYDHFAVARYEGDAPAVTIAPVVVNEDAAPSVIDLFAAFNDATDADASLVLTVYDNSNPALVSSAVIAPATGQLTLTYAPAMNGTATVKVRARDTSGLVSYATISITVNSVNDAPSFSLAGNPPTVNQDAGPQSVASFATGISAGPANEAAQVLTFNLAVGSTTGNLAFSSPPAINSATGELTYTTSPGTYGTATVNVTLQDNGSNTPPNVNSSGSQSFTMTVVQTSGLSVSSMTGTRSGFVAQFGRPFDPSVLNIYDQDALLGPTDLTVVGASSGAVTGSVVLDPASNKLTFIKTGAPLVADTYTVTMRSGANAFKAATGEMLDGNNNGIAGDNYVGSFVVAPSSAVTLSAPDFTRGFGQPVSLSGSGIPITLSTGQGVSRVDFTLRYDPTLLTISGAALGASILGATLSFTQSTPGVAVISVSQTGQFSAAAGALTLVNLTAQVPNTALYGAKHVLDISDLHIFNAAPTPVEVPSLDDDGIHIAAYLGDANGSQTYNSPDTTFAQRLIVGTYSGLSSYQLADPYLIVDTTRNGAVQSDDVTAIQRAIVGTATVEIPPQPALPQQGGPGGADPLVFIPQDLAASVGEILHAPVELLVTEATGITLGGADLAIAYDPARFALTGVEVGQLLVGFGLSVNTATPGLVRMSLSGSNALSLPFESHGTLASLSFLVLAGSGTEASLNLLAGAGMQQTALYDAVGRPLTLVPAPTDRADDAVDGRVRILSAVDAAFQDADDWTL